MGSIYSAEEILNFSEHSSEIGTLSLATTKKCIEVKVLHTTSSTTNRGKSHILGKNRKTKFQIQNKNISNIMSTSPIVTMTSKKIFVEIKISIL